jgi:hypothetical protein
MLPVINTFFLAARSSDLLSSPGESHNNYFDINFDDSLGKVLAAAAAASATNPQSGKYCLFYLFSVYLFNA